MFGMLGIGGACGMRGVGAAGCFALLLDAPKGTICLGLRPEVRAAGGAGGADGGTAAEADPPPPATPSIDMRPSEAADGV